MAEIMVGGVFIYSGFYHSSNPYQFAADAASYELTPVTFMRFFPFVLSSLMVTLGISLIAVPNNSVARKLSSIVFLVFTLAQSVSWLNGTEISCGCFGHSQEPISIKSISIPFVCCLICFANISVQRSLTNSSQN